MKKEITIENAVSMVKDGMTIMVGGFLALGASNQIIEALSKTGVKNLTIICNDSSFPDKSWGMLLANNQVKKVITSHIGTNPMAIEQYNSGELEVEFCPQGTLVERIRAKGTGLGGILTQTGLGTLVAEGKRIIEVQGKDYILEEPLGADIALIGASIADEIGNLVYKGTSANFNPTMAYAADVVIVEAEEVVKAGDLTPEAVHTPSILVDYIYRKK